MAMDSARSSFGTDGPEAPFPVQRRKQGIFIVRPDFQQQGETDRHLPGIDAPVLVDHTGLMLQRQGLTGEFAVCMNPTMEGAGKPVSFILSLSPSITESAIILA